MIYKVNGDIFLIFQYFIHLTQDSRGDRTIKKVTTYPQKETYAHGAFLYSCATIDDIKSNHLSAERNTRSLRLP
jgi:hypothetical protein